MLTRLLVNDKTVNDYTKEKFKFIAKQNIKSMDKMNVLIVDDELYGRENLALIIEQNLDDLGLLFKASNIEEATRILTNERINLVLLDIRLQEEIGFDLLDNYPNREFATIVVSGYDQYGITALKYGVVDYILKPINHDDLLIAIGKARDYINGVEKQEKSSQGAKIGKLKISTLNGFHLIDIHDIIHLESDSNYTNLYLTGGRKLIVSKTMKDFEPYLNESDFFRIHRSHIINLNFVTGYQSRDGGYVTLSDNSQVEVSRSRYKEFIDIISTRFNSIT